jgi:arginase family enzyme
MAGRHLLPTASRALARMAEPRFLGVPTFFRLPSQTDPDTWAGNVDIGLLGVPYDGGVTNRPGARHGPREVRNQSSLVRLFNQATGENPYTRCRVADLGDVVIQRPFDGVVAAHAEIQRAVERVVREGVLPVSVGGDHSVSLPILRAIYRASARPRTVAAAAEAGANGGMAMVHIDAHCDTGDEYFGSRFHHGAPFSRAVEEGAYVHCIREFAGYSSMSLLPRHMQNACLHCYPRAIAVWQRVSGSTVLLSLAGLLDPKKVIQIGIRGT